MPRKGPKGFVYEFEVGDETMIVEAPEGEKSYGDLPIGLRVVVKEQHYHGTFGTSYYGVEPVADTEKQLTRVMQYVYVGQLAPMVVAPTEDELAEVYRSLGVAPATPRLPLTEDLVKHYVGVRQIRSVGGDNGMFRGVCTCGQYQSRPSSKTDAWKMAQAHADAKNSEEES